MLASILQFKDLQKLCRPSGGRAPTRATVEKWMRDQHIPFKYDGQGGLLTTMEAVNSSLGVLPAMEQSECPSPHSFNF